tara:strand:- start:200 stop:688 length:489 start_codon:yes stop_codon:yes gene_type:complete
MAKKKSKNPVGRPKFEVTEEVLQRAERAMAQGLTKEQCAAALGISVSTFQLYQAENSEFSEAIKRGEALGIEEVTNALFENATLERDNTAIIFYLKNRAGWVDKKEVATTVEQKHVIDITRISDEQLSALATIFEQSNSGASQSREIPQIIEGVYESSLADD